MYALNSFLALLITFGLTEASILTKNEESLALNLINSINIRNALFIKSGMEKTSINNLKCFATSNIYVSYKSENELYDYIKENNNISAKTIITFKKGNLKNFNSFLKYLNNKSKLHLMSKFTWLVYLNKPSEIFDFPFFPPYDSEFIIALPNDTSYKLIKLYHLRKRKLFSGYGTWNPQTRLKISKTSLEKINMNQTDFKGSTHVCHKLNNYTSDMNRLLFCHKPNLVKDIVKWMNFRYEEFFLYKLNPEETLDMDFMLEPVILSGNSKHVNLVLKTTYLKYFPMERVEIYIKYPKEELSADFYIRPFEYDVWIAILISIVFGGAICIIVQYISTYVIKTNEYFSLSDLIFIAHESFCNQGSEDFKNTTFRLLAIILRFLALYIVPAYSSDLTAYLALRVLNAPFYDLETFVQNGQYQLYFNNKTFMSTYFQNRNDTIGMEIKRKFIGNYQGDDKTFTALCSNEKIAYITAVPYSMLEEIICRLFKIPNPIAFAFSTIILGPVVQPSPYANIINQKFMQLNEAGIIKKYRALERAEELFLPRRSADNEGFDIIQIGQIYQVFLFTAIGALLAVFIIFCELLIRNIKKRKGRK